MILPKIKRQNYKVWSKDKAKDWLKEHDFKTGSYEKIANYHSFRQENPDKYDSFKADKKPFDFKESDGVIVVYGIYQKEGKKISEIQTIKFYHGEKDKEEQKSINRQIEYRSYPFELRIDDSEEKPKMRGYSALFNQLSVDLGGFKETIKRGAFAKTIKESDIVATRNHNNDLLLGRNKSGTLILKEDKKGLNFEIDPPDATYAKDLIVSMERGDIDQCSFKFRTIVDEWDSKDKNNVIRILKEAELFDIAIVTDPAYIQTSAEYRSTKEVYKDFLKSQEKKEKLDDKKDKEKQDYKIALRKKLLELIEKF